MSQQAAMDAVVPVRVARALPEGSPARPDEPGAILPDFTPLRARAGDRDAHRRAKKPLNEPMQPGQPPIPSPR